MAYKMIGAIYILIGLVIFISFIIDNRDSIKRDNSKNGLLWRVPLASIIFCITWPVIIFELRNKSK